MSEADPIDSCPYRANVRGEGAGQAADCRWLVEASGIRDASLCEVRRDACACCVRASPGGPSDLNPVLASILHGLARRVIDRGGVAGCSTQGATALRVKAEASLDHDPGEVDDPYRPARAARPCHYLGASIGTRPSPLGGQFRRTPVSRCHHPDHRETTEAECRRCLDWSEGPGLDVDPPVLSLPIPATRCGPAIRSWSVGVTTSPRRRPTLEWTLDGLLRAGWDQPRLFLDGEVTVPHRHAGCPITYREPRLGAWPNFYLGLAELLLRDPEADAYLMVQDDVAFSEGVRLRDYLESILWPGDRPGPVSLYSSRVDARPEVGWTFHRFPWFLGAIALVFPGATARAFLVDPVVMRHRQDGPNGGLANVDTVVGEWAFRNETPIAFPTPSLCRHVGHASTLWPGAKVEGKRQEGPFAGESGTRPALPARRRDHFDEADFPCVEGRGAWYREAIDRGIREMRGRSVVICGLCNDVIRRLPDLAARVERLGAMFGDYRAVFHESGSADGSAEFLDRWSGANPAVRAIRERPGSSGTPGLRAHPASCRNLYRTHLLDHFRHFDHAIVVDPDLEGGWSFDGIAHTFGLDGWDFVGSNGLIRGPLGPEEPLFHDRWAYRPLLEYDGRVSARRGEPMRPVLSCFGGLGIYRMAAMVAEYGGDDCEHVTLHGNMRKLGFDRLFFNPSQITLYDRWE